MKDEAKSAAPGAIAGLCSIGPDRACQTRSHAATATSRDAPARSASAATNRRLEALNGRFATSCLPGGRLATAARSDPCSRSGRSVPECGRRSLVANGRLSRGPRPRGACAEPSGRLFRNRPARSLLGLSCGRRPASGLATSVGPRREPVDEAVTIPDLDTDRPRNQPARAFARVIIRAETLDEVIVRHSRGIEQTEAISWHTSAPLLPATAPDRCTCQANKRVLLACSLYRRGRKAFFSTLFQGIVCHMPCHFCKEKSVAEVLTSSIAKPR